MAARKRQTARQIFAGPLIVALLSAAGLLAALVGDGIWDAVSWATLLVPIALCAGFIARGRA